MVIVHNFLAVVASTFDELCLEVNTFLVIGLIVSSLERGHVSQSIVQKLFSNSFKLLTNLRLQFVPQQSFRVATHEIQLNFFFVFTFLVLRLDDVKELLVPCLMLFVLRPVEFREPEFGRPQVTVVDHIVQHLLILLLLPVLLFLLLSVENPFILLVE